MKFIKYISGILALTIVITVFVTYSPSVEEFVGDLKSKSGKQTLATQNVIIDFPNKTSEGLMVPTRLCSTASCAAEGGSFTITTDTANLSLNSLRLYNDDNGSDFSSRFEIIYILDEFGNVLDSTTLTDTGNHSDGEIYFDNLNKTLSAETEYLFHIHAAIQPIVDSPNTGFFLNYYLPKTSSDYIELENLDVGDNLSPSEITNLATTGDIFQPFYVARRTKPTIEINNDSASKNVTGTTNAAPIYNFSITADDSGDIDWAELSFDTKQNTNIKGSNYYIYETGNPAPLNSIPTNTYNFEPSGKMKITFIPDEIQRIPAGTTKNYHLEADLNILDPILNGAIKHSLIVERNPQLITDTLVYVQNSIGPGFIWSDISSRSHSTVSSDWTNGYLVDVQGNPSFSLKYIGTGG